MREIVGEPTKVLDDSRAQAFEGGQSFAPYARAQEARISVRGVDRVRDAMSADMGVHVGATGPDERPNAVAFVRGQDGQPPGSGAAQDPDEHGLGPIVGVVPGRDPVGADAGGGGTQRFPARGAGSRLEIAAGSDGDAGATEGHVEGAGESLGKIELCAGRFAQPVVDAVREQAERELGAQKGEHVQQGHRVRTAAHRHQYRRAAWDEAMVAESGARDRDERGGVGARHRSAQIEFLAELERVRLQGVAARLRRIGERASLGRPVEVDAVLAGEAEGEPRGLGAQAIVHPGPHGRLRSRHAAISTWLVCGNISNVASERRS